MCMTRCLLGAVVVIGLHAIVDARPSAAQPPPGRLVALDVFAGATEFGGVDPPEAGEGDAADVAMRGWLVGSSVRFFKEARWLSVVASHGQYSNEDVRVRDVLVGAEAMSPWLVSHLAAFRGFTHALVGYASERPKAAGQPSSSGPELLVGGGLDFNFFFRVQAEYVRWPLLPRNDVRGVICGVVPLCFRGCREWADGVPVRRR